MGTVLRSVRWSVVGGALVALAAVWAVCGKAARAGEPAALNPFGAVRKARDDAVQGYLEMSDGRVYVGNVYMTRDKRLKMEDSMRQVGGGDGAADDNSDKRQREIPLRAIREIEAKVEKEWIEKEWRFKELALDEKYFTGRTYPVRKYVYTVTLKDDRKITAPVAEIFYLKPFRELAGGARTDEEPEAVRFMIHKRDKGHPGTSLKSLAYVKLIKLGAGAVEEGKKKAAKAPAERSKKSSGSGTGGTAVKADASEDEENAKPAANEKEDEDDRPARAKKKPSKKPQKQEDEL